MSIFAVYNLKGGVGKTSTAVNLAYLSAEDGFRTLLWDLDPQGAASFYYRIRPHVKGGGKGLVRRKHPIERAIRGTDFEQLDLLPADFSYRNMDRFIEGAKKPAERMSRLLKPLRKAYEHVFLDCPDALSALSESLFLAADALLIPVIPTTLSLLTFDQIRTYLARQVKTPPRVLPFFCMVDRRKKLHREITAAHAGDPDGFLSSSIPYASAVERMGVERAPLPSYDRRGRASLAYRALWKEVQAAL